MKDTPISTRCLKLHQFLSGQPLFANDFLSPREALLDVLLAVHVECKNSEKLKREKAYASFIQKYDSLVTELNGLKLTKEDFEPKNVIGRGHFGEVRLVREKYTGCVYAMKTLNKQATLDQDSSAFFENERNIMANGSSPWLTALEYAFQDHENLYLVMEFHPGGDLLSFLTRQESQTMDEEMLKFYGAEMVLAINALHELGFVHRDIKPDNILLDRKGHVKLADFGSAARIIDGKVQTGMPVGTPDYIAPEVLQSMEGKRCQPYGTECDWWSLGVVIYEMLYGETPFADDTMVQIYSNIMNFEQRLEFPEDDDWKLSDEGVSLIRSLICKQRVRLDFTGLKDHVFFSKTSWDSILTALPPFVPELRSIDDVSHFDYEDLAPSQNRALRNGGKFGSRSTNFTGHDLPFCGFSFSKNLVDAAQVAASSTMGGNNQELESQITQKNRELKENKEKIHQLQIENTDKKQAVQELTTVLGEKKASFDEVCRENEEMRQDNVLLQAKMNNKQRQFKQLEADHKKLSAEVERNMKSSMQALNDTESEELLKCKRKITEMEQQGDVLQRQKSRLEEELLQLTDKSKVQKKNIVDSQTKYAVDTEKLRKKLSDLQSELLAKTDEHNKSEERLRASQNSEQDLQVMLDKARTDCGDLQRELNTAKSSSNSAQERELMELKNRNEYLQKSLDDKVDLTSDIENKGRALLEDLEQRYANIFKTHETEKEELRKSNEKFRLQLQELESSNKTLEEEKENVKTRLMRTKSSSDSKYQGEISRLEQEIGELKSRNEELHNKLTERTNSSDRIMDKEINTLKERLKNERHAFDAKTNKMADQIDELRTENRSLQSKIDTIQNNMKQKDSNINSLKEQMDSLQNENSILGKDRIKMLMLEQKINVNDQELIEKQTLLTKYDTELQKVRSDLSAKELELETQRSLVGNNDNRVAQLRTELGDLKEQKEVLEGDLKEAKEGLRDSSQRQTALHRKYENLSQRTIQLQEDYNETKLQLQETLGSLETAQQHEEQLSNTVSGYKILIDQLENEKTRYTHEATNLREKLAQSTGKSSEVNNKYKEQIDNLKRDVAQLKDEKHLERNKNEQLNVEIEELEAKCGLYKHNTEKLNKNFENEVAKSKKMEMEISRLNDENTRQSTLSFQLRQDLNEETEKYNNMASRYNSQTKNLEELQAQILLDQMKFKQKENEYLKLIDHLNGQLQRQPVKKTKGKPGSKGNIRSLSSNITEWKHSKEAKIAAQRRNELEHLLKLEREKNRELKEKLASFKDQTPPQLRKSNDSLSITSGFGSRTNLNTAKTHSQSIPGMASTEEVPSRLAKMGMTHSIPHRFEEKTTLKSETCTVCRDVIGFGKKQSKCKECRVVSHLKCQGSVPQTCGLPAELMEHFTKALNTPLSPEPAQKTPVRVGTLQEGKLKVMKAARGQWAPYHVMLSKTDIKFCHPESLKLDPTLNISLESMEMSLSTVTLTDLPYVAERDMPFVISLSFKNTPKHAWPPRDLFLLCPSFSEKQQWIGTLESITSKCAMTSGSEYFSAKNIVTLSGPDNKEINCSWLFDDNTVLVGTEQGLFALLMHKLSSGLIRVPELKDVHSIHGSRDCGTIAMIVGIDNVLNIVTFSEMEQCYLRCMKNRNTKPLQSQAIKKFSDCHLAKVGKISSDRFVAVAQENTIQLLLIGEQGSLTIHSFIDTEDTCNSLTFSGGLLLTSTKKFYLVDPITNTLDQFLDPNDTTLAFYTYGAVQRGVLPVGLVYLQDTEEILLCYPTMGVFVDKKGNRSRPHDIQWGRTPITFEYSAPFLFISHVNCLQMIELSSEMCTDTYIQPPRYAEMIANTRCIGVTPKGTLATNSTSHASNIMLLTGKVCPRPTSFVESVSSTHSSERGSRYSPGGEERFSDERYGADQYRAEQYGPPGSDTQYRTQADRFISEDELYAAQENQAQGAFDQRTSSVSEYFGRPINLNASMQSSLMDDIGDEWETRSEVARF
ncbi:citron Rho-interacting kinase-like isoform X2 [Bolinopsis microptera]|uniref:citron Rho-interacting kinase-like isoform X2 n=1 Tax=Bolinopsis microptera TaxID=2820187 RepID=UPI00307A083F